MGTDKGLLKLHAVTWAQTALDKLHSLQLPVVLSINKDQFAAYSTIFDTSRLVIDKDPLQIRGPLCGVLSVHLSYPADDLFILGCDLPLMETDLLNELVSQHQQQDLKEAFAYTNDGEPEPLCGIYTSKGLAHVHSLLQTNQLHKHSMKFMLEQIKSQFTPVPEDKKKCFRNFNAHAELNGL
jgi:molybdopterin-guanine dinucleotide biosynthesis protein A